MCGLSNSPPRNWILHDGLENLRIPFLILWFVFRRGLIILLRGPVASPTFSGSSKKSRNLQCGHIEFECRISKGSSWFRGNEEWV